MNVRQMIEYLQQFEDQEAEVRVLHCEPGHSYYMQGGSTTCVNFDPEKHFEYVDFRDNPFSKGAPHENERYVTLGLNEG